MAWLSPAYASWPSWICYSPLPLPLPLASPELLLVLAGSPPCPPAPYSSGLCWRHCLLSKAVAPGSCTDAPAQGAAHTSAALQRVMPIFFLCFVRKEWKIPGVHSWYDMVTCYNFHCFPPWVILPELAVSMLF